MRPMPFLACLTIFLCLGCAGVAASAETPPASCPSKLKDVQAAKALAYVKLEEEIERADAQTYLTRLELSITKKKLAETLAKCGAACTSGSDPGVAK